MARKWVTAANLGRWSNPAWGAGEIYLQYDENSVSLTNVVARIKIDIDTPGETYDSSNWLKCNAYVLINWNKTSDYKKGTQICRKANFKTSDESFEIFNLYKTDFPTGFSDVQAFGTKFYFPTSMLYIPEPGVSLKTPTDFMTEIVYPFTLINTDSYEMCPDQTVAIPLTATKPLPNWFCYITDLGNNSFRVNAGMGKHEECKNNKFYDGKVTLTITEPTDTLNNTAKPNFSAFDFQFSSKTYTEYGTYQLGSMYQQTDTQHIIDLNTMPGSAEVTYTMKSDKVSAYRRSWFTIKAVFTLTDIYGKEYVITKGRSGDLTLEKAIYIHKAPDQIPSTPYLDMNSLEHKSRVTLKENHWTFKWTLPDDYDQADDRYITANGGRVMGLRARLLRTRDGKISTVPIVDPNKVAEGKKGTSAYHAGVVIDSADIGYVNNSDGSKVYLYRNDHILLPANTTSINISPASVDNLTGFKVGDKVSFQVSTYSKYGANFDNASVDNKLVSNVKTATTKEVQNAAVAQVRTATTWKEGIVQVYQNEEWVEAEAVYVYTADGKWVEST